MKGEECVPMGLPSYAMWDEYKHEASISNILDYVSKTPGFDKAAWDKRFSDAFRNYPWAGKIKILSSLAGR